MKKHCLNCKKPIFPHWKYCDRKECVKEVSIARWKKAQEKRKLTTQANRKQV